MVTATIDAMCLPLLLSAVGFFIWYHLPVFCAPVFSGSWGLEKLDSLRILQGHWVGMVGMIDVIGSTKSVAVVVAVDKWTHGFFLH